MSDPINKSDASPLNKEAKKDENSEPLAFSPGNLKNLELASKNNLNESHSPKVTIETFHEQSKAKFQSAFFSGTYQDRVYVESLGSFRDRVIVDEEETRFIKNLRSVLKKNKKFKGEQFQDTKSKFSPVKFSNEKNPLLLPFYLGFCRKSLVIFVCP